LIEQLQALEKDNQQFKETDGRYKIDRLRQRVRILEPQEKVDPYTRRNPRDELSREIIRWSEISDGEDLAGRVRKCLQLKSPASQQRVLTAALNLSPRLGPEVTVGLLDRVLPAVEGLPPVYAPADLHDRVPLLERALLLAAHHDKVELVDRVILKYLELLREAQAKSFAFDALEGLAGQSLRGLRRLGLKDKVAMVLRQLEEAILRGLALDELRGRLKGNWKLAMVSLLHLAAGWLHLGEQGRAAPIMEAGREILLSGELNGSGDGHLKMKVASAYVGALAQGATEPALQGIEELFQQMSGFHEIWTSLSHYFVLQIQFVDAVVLAVVSDDFAMGPGARRWLDEDEYLVRKRIHRDVRRSLVQSE